MAPASTIATTMTNLRMEVQEKQFIFRVSSNEVLIEIEFRRFTDIGCPFFVELLDECLHEFIELGMFAFNTTNSSLLDNARVTKTTQVSFDQQT